MKRKEEQQGVRRSKRLATDNSSSASLQKDQPVPKENNNATNGEKRGGASLSSSQLEGNHVQNSMMEEFHGTSEQQMQIPMSGGIPIRLPPFTMPQPTRGKGLTLRPIQAPLEETRNEQQGAPSSVPQRNQYVLPGLNPRGEFSFDPTNPGNFPSNMIMPDLGKHLQTINQLIQENQQLKQINIELYQTLHNSGSRILQYEFIFIFEFSVVLEDT